MLRPAFLSLVIVLGLQFAQAQYPVSGPPASALSPTADGRLHGVPASALSLKPVPPGVNTPFPLRRTFVTGGPQRPFHPFDPDHHRHRVIVPVPLFYPVYTGDYTAPSSEDPNVAQASDPAAEEPSSAQREDALRQAYLQGQRDALRNELDTRKPETKAPTKKPPEETEAPPKPDDSPATVFIFKDGHQLETKNYAIMGQTLYDLSGAGVKKVSLADVDSQATVKANDDRGIQVRLP